MSKYVSLKYRADVTKPKCTDFENADESTFSNFIPRDQMDGTLLFFSMRTEYTDKLIKARDDTNLVRRTVNAKLYEE